MCPKCVPPYPARMEAMFPVLTTVNFAKPHAIPTTFSVANPASLCGTLHKVSRGESHLLSFFEDEVSGCAPKPPAVCAPK